MKWKIEPNETNFLVVIDDGKVPATVVDTLSTQLLAEEKIRTLEDIQKRTIVDDAVMYRYCRVAEKDFEGENKFQVAAASEFPGEQRATKEHERLGIAKEGEKYLEILSHEKGDADLSRFNGENRASFLDEHMDNRHLGPVHRAEVSPDKVTRAVVEFDNASKLSKTRRTQMSTGSRPNISLGYAHKRYLGPQTLPDGKIGHRFAWQGLEISSVAVPMDPTVGLARGAKKEYHCIRCGGMMERSKLNEDFMCPDCSDAEDPAGNETGRSEGVRMFRVKIKDAEQRVSHADLRNKVAVALDSDKRFKSKRENGDLHSDFHIHDIHQIVGANDGDEWQAIVQSPAWSKDSKYFAVDFSYDGKDVTLGKEHEGEPKTTFETNDRGLTLDGRRIRSSTREVDSRNLSTAAKTAPNILPKTIMLKTAAELATENPEAVAAIRTESEKTTRTAVLGEIDAKNKRVTEFNKEVRARADEIDKQHGHKWNGKTGEKFVVGSAIRKLEAEICAWDDTHDSAERRAEFTRRAVALYEGATEPRVDMPADVTHELASRCSLGRIIREGMNAAEKGNRTKMFMISDGAEHEADREIRKNALEFPGGASLLPDGIQLPNDMPSGIRPTTPVRRLTSNRMKRDALAGDFTTAGALIAPDYVFPIIELLRNWPALSRAGMTILSGILGNPVLPRLESPTTAQSIAEGGALAQYDQVLGQIKLSPHRVGTSQKYSRLALLQTAADFEAMVMADHMAQLALKIDYLGLNGQGAGDEPLGLLNQLIQSVAFAGSAANAYKNVVLMETLIRAANVPEDVSYITTSTGRGMLKSVARLLIGATTVAAEPVWTDNDEVNGRPAWDSQQVPGNVIVAGAFRHLVMVQFGGIAIVLDTISQANQDKYWLNLNTYIDYALRHNQAFCRSADSIGTLS